jgi:hypothetical protein
MFPYKPTPPEVAGKLVNDKEPNIQQRTKNLLLAFPVYEDFCQVASVRDVMATLFTAFPEDRIRELGGDRAAFEWLQLQVRRG